MRSGAKKDLRTNALQPTRKGDEETRAEVPTPKLVSSYLEPISQSLQKPIEDRSRIGCPVNQNHDENREMQRHLPNYIKRGYSLP